jgi:hypothetical protein
MTGSRNDKKDTLLSLYQDKRTVFRLVDVAMITGETDRRSLAKKLNYYVGKGALQNPRKGIYTKPDYNPEELACRVYSPSYISLEYVLARSGVIFQYHQQFTVVSYLSRTIEVDDLSFRYRKIKDKVLANGMGIAQTPGQATMASAERAFLDMLYLDPGFYFDNPGILDRKLLKKLLPVYQSKALSKRASKIVGDD